MTWTSLPASKAPRGAAALTAALMLLIAVATSLTGAAPAFGRPTAAMSAEDLRHLTPVMAWVESGRQPDRIVASKVEGGQTTRNPARLPLPGRRPLHRHRKHRRRRQLRPVNPGHPTGPGYSLVGSRLDGDDYQTWCRADGTALLCSPRKTWRTARATRS